MNANSTIDERLDVVRPCRACGNMRGTVTSWHRVSDGFVGYLRCGCGTWAIVRTHPSG